MHGYVSRHMWKPPIFHRHRHNTHTTGSTHKPAKEDVNTTHTRRRVAPHTQMNAPSNVLGRTRITSAFASPPPPCTISQTVISYQSSTETFTLVHANTEWFSSLL